MAQSHSMAIRNPPNHLQEDPDVEENIMYCTTPAHLVTEKQLQICSYTFTKYYGVWNETAQRVHGKDARPGYPIEVTVDMMRRYYLPTGAKTVLVTAVTGNGRQIAHCFISQWKHENDFVFWITQIVVHPLYRNQRKATRMLQAFTNIYKIGVNPQRRDFVGVLSSHPHAICAVLRVFGRGIEALPSKPDWERQPYDYPHAPLRGSLCTSMMQASPFTQIHDADVDRNGVTAYTRFHIDNAVPKEALEGIRYAMNKQLRTPWQWLFGDLEDGWEYLCILEYRSDPGHNMRPRHPSPGPSSLDERTWRKPVCDDFAVLNQHMIRVMRRQNEPSRFGPMNQEIMSERLRQAGQAVSQDPDLIVETMDGKRVPDAVRKEFSTGEWDEEMQQHRVVPDEAVTWYDFKLFAWEVYCDDRDAQCRMLMLQALHYQLLLEECARVKLQKESGGNKHDSMMDDLADAFDGVAMV